ncbi:AlkA N-terminal domain-containing protein, partial [Methylobacterium sp. WL69]|uniref:AlkA N-terminal domain-containing protein n=1 Tax=Methylobacterium sp. WL69 TaxID=2603893 RepID=UPI00248481DB
MSNILPLPYTPPYDRPALCDDLAARAIPGVEAITRLAYRRTVGLFGRHGHAADPHLARLVAARPGLAGAGAHPTPSRRATSPSCAPSTTGAGARAPPAWRRGRG